MIVPLRSPGGAAGIGARWCTTAVSTVAHLAAGDRLDEHAGASAWIEYPNRYGLSDFARHGAFELMVCCATALTPAVLPTVLSASAKLDVSAPSAKRSKPGPSLDQGVRYRCVTIWGLISLVNICRKP